jgi:hypothetical protein
MAESPVERVSISGVHGLITSNLETVKVIAVSKVA